VLPIPSLPKHAGFNNCILPKETPLLALYNCIRYHMMIIVPLYGMKLKAPFKCKASFKLLTKMLYWTDIQHLLILVSLPDILYMNAMPSQPMPSTHRSSPNRCLCSSNSYAHYLTHHHLLIVCFSISPPKIDLQFTSSDQPQTNPADTTDVAASLVSGCESLLSSAHSQCQHLRTYQHTANPL